MKNLFDDLSCKIASNITASQTTITESISHELASERERARRDEQSRRDEFSKFLTNVLQNESARNLEIVKGMTLLHRVAEVLYHSCFLVDYC